MTSCQAPSSASVSRAVEAPPAPALVSTVDALGIASTEYRRVFGFSRDLDGDSRDECHRTPADNYLQPRKAPARQPWPELARKLIVLGERSAQTALTQFGEKPPASY